MNQRFPHLRVRRCCVESLDEQTFGRTTARKTFAEQTCGKHARVVDDEQISRTKQVRKVSKLSVVEPSGRTIDHEQTRLAALGRRLLGDQLRRQVERKVGKPQS
jgi:hypothetical protein